MLRKTFHWHHTVTTDQPAMHFLAADPCITMTQNHVKLIWLSSMSNAIIYEPQPHAHAPQPYTIHVYDMCTHLSL